MPEKKHKSVNPQRSKTPPSGGTEQVRSGETSQGRGNRLRDELDDLLEEIDQVLETNAEEFVNSYVQKGGQ